MSAALRYPLPARAPLRKPVALVSLLHESATKHSAARPLAGLPVLAWTLERLTRSSRLAAVVVTCWQDQLARVSDVAEAAGAEVICRGARRRIPQLEMTAAARRWADGWRGGLAAASAFDQGWVGPWVREAADAFDADALVLVDPAAALLDPAVVDALCARAGDRPAANFTFAPAAPGGGALLLRRAQVDALAASGDGPGTLLSYHPGRVAREPLAQETCHDLPPALTRVAESLLADTDAAAVRIEAALDGDAPTRAAGDVVLASLAARPPDALPRTLDVELTTRRAARPVWQAETAETDLDFDAFERACRALAARDDARLTLAGRGDPLLHPRFADALALARSLGLAVHVETDLLDADDTQLAALVEHADVVSVALPGLSPATYAAHMNVDGLARAVDAVRRLVALRAASARGTPVVVPTFVKTRLNLAEMEPWYDRWLAALGSAVIRGLPTHGATQEKFAVLDTAPAARSPCRRLASRLALRADGAFAACDESPDARLALGDDLRAAWTERLTPLRQTHADGRYGTCGPCTGCRNWHRP